MRSTVPFRKNSGNLMPSDFFKGVLGSSVIDDLFNNNLLSTSNPLMKTDIQENDKEYVLEAEIPGFNKEDIEIEWNNGQLTLHASKREEINEENKNFIRRERHYGEISRSFLVENIKENEIKAEYKDGILKVVIPKSDGGEKKKKISIE